MAKAGARYERKKNPYYMDGKYWPNKTSYKKARKERLALKAERRAEIEANLQKKQGNQGEVDQNI